MGRMGKEGEVKEAIEGGLSLVSGGYHGNGLIQPVAAVLITVCRIW